MSRCRSALAIRYLKTPPSPSTPVRKQPFQHTTRPSLLDFFSRKRQQTSVSTRFAQRVVPPLTTRLLHVCNTNRSQALSGLAMAGNHHRLQSSTRMTGSRWLDR